LRARVQVLRILSLLNRRGKKKGRVRDLRKALNNIKLRHLTDIGFLMYSPSYVSAPPTLYIIDIGPATMEKGK